MFNSSYFSGLFELIKPRIAVLVLITTYSGMWLGKGEAPAWDLTLFTLLGVALAGGSSSMLNNYIDRYADALMERTQSRALVKGKVTPLHALIIGILMSICSFVILWHKVNLLTATMAFSSVICYVLIYTCWLKRTTPLCTVLGGVAGAMPPVMGLAAVGEIGIEALILFTILFIWQPPHFWALALIRSDEYKRAGFPILPVVKGPERTKIHMLVYTIVLVPCSLLPYFFDMSGIVYLWLAIVLGAIYTIWTIIFISKPFSVTSARKLFYFSIFYLTVLYIGLFADCKVGV